MTNTNATAKIVPSVILETMENAQIQYADLVMEDCSAKRVS